MHQTRTGHCGGERAALWVSLEMVQCANVSPSPISYCLIWTQNFTGNQKSQCYEYNLQIKHISHIQKVDKFKLTFLVIRRKLVSPKWENRLVMTKCNKGQTSKIYKECLRKTKLPVQFIKVQ